MLWNRSTRKLPSVRRALIWLGAACTFPTVLVASIATIEGYVLRKDRVYESALGTARNLVAELDRELRGVDQGLRVLTTSPELHNGNLGAFQRRLRDALALQNVDAYVLTDSHGNELVNTKAPLTSRPIRSALPSQVLEQARSEAGVVTNLFNTGLTGEQTIAVGVPITSPGKANYALLAEMRPQRISHVLRRQAMPEGWVAAALDSDALIVGRTREEIRYVGQHAVESLSEAISTSREGTLRSKTKEGTAVLTAFSHSRDGRWAVAVGAPMSSLQADLWRSMSWVLGVGIGIILAGLWAAYRLALQIGGSITSLVDPALALGRGQSVAVPRTAYAETAQLGASLLHAGELLTHAQKLAYFDPLTALCNRVLFSELASHALVTATRTGRPVSLLALDLDNFKAVNDTYGHSKGDDVLKIAAQRMRATLRESDVLARYGGDEFLLLLEPADSKAAEIVAKKLVAALRAPYPGVDIAVSVSIGIAAFPSAGQALEDLMKQADRALYDAKAAGRDQYVTALSDRSSSRTVP
ncbi:sensor domain-containing diguanylate cyclase [Achromobacter insolitus]|uniref:GGDEF domain-containing protein n=1 Tax=Achromobacter insolitus TaxID=217204 RepID=UPI00174B8D4C|nr:sensor domain-containing diguanylate cyclase [Achromobacter insolitus]